jgi:hypothetical protein
LAIFTVNTLLTLIKESQMAKAKRIPLNELLAEVASKAKPAKPALSSTDKAYLRGLKKRGFTNEELIELAAKAGLTVTVEMLEVKPKTSKELIATQAK